MSACPSDGTWQRLVVSAAGEKTFSRFEQHLESCADCRALLQSVVDGDLRGAGALMPGVDDFPAIPGFRVERELGRGAHGVVVLARSTKLDRPVALKIVLTGLEAARTYDAGPLSEERAVAALRHPNIVPLHDVVHLGPWTVLVLEYVPGGSLKDRLSGPLEPAQVVRILETVARAVAHVHQHELLHLDIKPSNILVDAEPDCPLDEALLKLTDFGISLPLAQGASEGGAVLRGTPGYMSPEQAGLQVGPIGPAADIYGLGALLYCLLCGRPPIVAASKADAAEPMGTVDPIPPRQFNAAIPRDLESICLHCLEKQPDRRYASADALAEDLRRFLDGRQISIRPASIEQFSRWCRRRPVIAGLAVALVCTLVVSIGGLAHLLKQARAERLAAIEARQMAEADAAIATRTLEELDTFVQQIQEEPTLLDDEYLPTIIENIRSLARYSAADRQTPSRMAVLISTLNRQLAGRILRSGNPDRSAQTEAILSRTRLHLTECLRWKPDSQSLREQLVYALLESADVVLNQWKYDDVEVFCTAAAQQAVGIAYDDLRLNTLRTVSMKRHVSAYNLYEKGKRDASRRLMRANLAMLDGMSAADSASSQLQLQRALTLSWLGRNDEAVAVLRGLPAVPSSADGEYRNACLVIRQWLVVPVVEWIFWSPPADIDEHELQQQAQHQFDAFRQWAICVGVSEPEIPAIGAALHGFVYAGLTAERRQHWAERDSRPLRRASAFVECLVKAYPASADAHVLIGRICIQKAKHAWHFDDVGAAQAALRDGILIVRRAQAMDPDSQSAAQVLADLERRLKKSEDELRLSSSGAQ